MPHFCYIPQDAEWEDLEFQAHGLALRTDNLVLLELAMSRKRKAEEQDAGVWYSMYSIVLY